MFDKEVVKKELREKVIVNETDSVDLDEVVENYEVIDGFYVFRIMNDGHVFQNNNFVESCPGLYAGGEDSGRH